MNLSVYQTFWKTKSQLISFLLIFPLLLAGLWLLQNPRVEAQVENITEKIEGVNSKTNASSEVKKTIQDLEKENLDYQTELVNLEKAKTQETDTQKAAELSQKIADLRSKIETNKTLITELSQEKQELDIKKEEEVEELKKTILDGGLTTSKWFIVIVTIWIGFEVLSILIGRFVANTKIKNYSKTILFLISLLSTIVILLYLFAPNLSVIFASLSLVSAAAVFAFQELFSSLVSFPLIKIQRLYKKGDVVKFGESGSDFTGKIIKIDLLRTLAEERLGLDENHQAEQNTRKIISLPNNTILKYPIINFSQNDNIIKDNIHFVITFGSDLSKARVVIRDLMNVWISEKFVAKKYLEMLEIYLDIADDGPKFTIWYPTKVGQSRLNRTEISTRILEALAQNHLHLAYKTVTLDK